ncbi:MAG: hypothetical protein RIM72_11020 [Alphaproteobacteria bacterium]
MTDKEKNIEDAKRIAAKLRPICARFHRRGSADTSIATGLLMLAIEHGLRHGDGRAVAKWLRGMADKLDM